MNRFNSTHNNWCFRILLLDWSVYCAVLCYAVLFCGISHFYWSVLQSNPTSSSFEGRAYHATRVSPRGDFDRLTIIYSFLQCWVIVSLDRCSYCELRLWTASCTHVVSSLSYYPFTVRSTAAPSEGPPYLQANHEGSKSSLTVKWEGIPVNSRNGILKGYHIYYKDSSSSGPLRNMSVASSLNEVLITDLQPYTAYDIKVCGFTVAGDGVCRMTNQRTRSLSE